MNVDDELCLCFHVSWRKVINYIRVHRVRVPSQVAECQSAGTGCGWCRRSISKLVERVQQQEPDPQQLQEWLESLYSSRRDYEAGREQYIARGDGVPPSE